MESAYEACLHQELVTRRLKVERQKPLPLVYGDVALDCVYRMDMLVERWYTAIADRAVILVKGTTVYEGSTADLRAQPELRLKYLGV